MITEEDAKDGVYVTASLAKTANVTENAQKSTESDESAEDEQTVIEGEKGAETADNDVKMSVVAEADESAGDVIDLSLDTELATIVDGVYGSQKYKKIAQYILEVLGDEEIILSDGRKAIVDKSDAMHIANKAAPKKTAKIAKIKEIIQKARIYAQDTNAEHNKFNQFYYYEAKVKLGDETFPVYLNVGKAKNDGTYHIYDITNKIKDTADRINGLERPKPNEGYALKNGIFNSSISQSSQKVNGKFSRYSDTAGAQTVDEGEKGAEVAEVGVKMSVVGESSETADLSTLELAKMRIERGIPASQVRKYLGWWQGKDGKWRYEIADNEMRFERDGLYRNPQTLKDYIKHDKLFRAYPHLRNVRVKFERVVEGDPKTNGLYDAINNTITLKSGRSNEDTKRTLVHEIQHAVQEYEEFSKGFNTNGGYVEWFNQVFDKVKDTREYKSLKTAEERWDYVENIATLPGEGAIDKAAKSLYRNNYGEIEARATAERLDMNEEQRRESPIVNDGNAYSLEEIYSKFVDNLRSMGYTDTQIKEIINGDKTNGRTEEIGSGTRGRNANGKHIETDRQSAQSPRNINSRGEGKNPEHIYDGRVKYSLSEIDADYLTAVENGDMETAQRIVEEAAKATGYTVKTYHGTPNSDFTVDDNGNVIPLSERFNEGNEDIRYSVTISDLENEYDVKINTDIVDLYSTKDYNNFGWARVNNILSSGENEEFKRRLQDKSKYSKTLKGEYMIPVGDYGDVKRGADNVIVFVKGTFNDPVITQVVRINLDNDTECSYVREEITNNLSKGARYDTVRNIIEKTYGKELLARYTRDGAPSLREIRQANNTDRGGADNRGLDLGRGSNSNAEREISRTEEVKHSVSEAVETESEASYEQLKRQLEKQKQKNKELAGELIRTHGKKLDPKAVKENLKDIIERYQATAKPADVERKFQRAFEYVFNKKLVTYNEDGSLGLRIFMVLMLMRALRRS